MIIAEDQIKAGDIVWVPFPFVVAPRLRERPALVVGVATPARNADFLWVLMITSSANKGWQGDISLEQRFADCGLSVPCVIRTAKITTVEVGRVRRQGALPLDLLTLVRQTLELKLR